MQQPYHTGEHGLVWEEPGSTRTCTIVMTLTTTTQTIDVAKHLHLNIYKHRDTQTLECQTHLRRQICCDGNKVEPRQKLCEQSAPGVC